MRAPALLAALAALLASAPARAQIVSPLVSSTVPYVLSGTVPVSLDAGPWVIGDVVVLAKGLPVGDLVWRDKVRALRGSLYTKADVLSDVAALKEGRTYDSVVPSLYQMSLPVPPEFAGVTGSTVQVRLVFDVVLKAAETPQPGALARGLPPTPVSGVILTPTAYRGAGKYVAPGLGLDINATYFIGRLYGKNNLSNPITGVTPPAQTNYIDRIGLWILTADGKMQVQSEGTWRPAFSVGGEGTLMFRDSGQPQVTDPNPTVTAKVNSSQKSTRILSDAYFVFSKMVGPVRTSAGIKQGDWGDLVGQLTEFLSPDALRIYSGHSNQETHSHTVPFASVMFLPKPHYPLALEILKFNGAPLNPILFNFKVGYFLHLNFDVALLKFDGGYDVIGLIQFRYNHFPQR